MLIDHHVEFVRIIIELVELGTLRTCSSGSSSNDNNNVVLLVLA